MDTAAIKSALKATSIKASVANIGYGARVTVATDKVDAALAILAPFFVNGIVKHSFCTVGEGKSQIVVR